MKKNRFFLCLLILLALLLLMFPKISLHAAQDGLLLWFNKVLPSLLPFMILINMLARFEGVSSLTSFLSPFTQKIWHLNGESFFVYIMGLIAGYPMGARLIYEFYQNQKLSQSEAQKMLFFCNNCGPLFIVGTVGTALIGNLSIGYFLLLIHFLSTLCISLVFSHYPSEARDCKKLSTPSSLQSSFASIFNESVTQSMDIITCVGGYIIFFSVLTHLITQTEIFVQLAHVFPFRLLTLPYLKGLFAGTLELSNGISILAAIKEMGPLTLSTLSFMMAFGGFCIYFQTLYVLKEMPFSAKAYLLAKLLQGLFAFLITLALHPFYVILICHHAYSISVFPFVILFISLFMSYLLVSKTQKNCF